VPPPDLANDKIGDRLEQTLVNVLELAAQLERTSKLPASRRSCKTDPVLTSLQVDDAQPPPPPPPQITRT